MEQRVDWKDVAEIAATSTDGTTYTVIHKQQFERHKFLDNTWSPEKPNGVERFELPDGTEAFRMANGTFELAGSGVVLTPKG